MPRWWSDRLGGPQPGGRPLALRRVGRRSLHLDLLWPAQGDARVWRRDGGGCGVGGGGLPQGAGGAAGGAHHVVAAGRQRGRRAARFYARAGGRGEGLTLGGRAVEESRQATIGVPE